MKTDVKNLRVLFMSKLTMLEKHEKTFDLFSVSSCIKISTIGLNKVMFIALISFLFKSCKFYSSISYRFLLNIF